MFFYSEPLIFIIQVLYFYKFAKSFHKVRTDRSSRPEVFCKKGVLRNFVKFTGKHLCQSLFFNKVAGQNTEQNDDHTHIMRKVQFCSSLKSFAKFIEKILYQSLSFIKKETLR